MDGFGGDGASDNEGGEGEWDRHWGEWGEGAEEAEEEVAAGMGLWGHL